MSVGTQRMRILPPLVGGLLLAALASGCMGRLPATPTPATHTPAPLTPDLPPPAGAPTHTPTALPVVPQEVFQAVQIRLVDETGGEFAGNLETSKPLRLFLESKPVQYSPPANPAATPGGDAAQPWANHPVRLMQVCVSVDVPCEPGAPWFAFEERLRLDPIYITPGMHQVWVGVRFADAQAQPLQAVSAGLVYPQASASVTYAFTGAAAAQPGAEQTAQAAAAEATQTALARPFRPVQGSISLQGGSCCIGGVVGTSAPLAIELAAQSSQGSVTEMRLLERSGNCPTLSDMSVISWQPFTTTVAMDLPISTVNWVGLYFGAQFRDSQGNVSPVYCDDISVEGMPAPPTP